MYNHLPTSFIFIFIQIKYFVSAQSKINIIYIKTRRFCLHFFLTIFIYYFRQVCIQSWDKFKFVSSLCSTKISIFGQKFMSTILWTCWINCSKLAFRSFHFQPDHVFFPTTNDASASCRQTWHQALVQDLHLNTSKQISVKTHQNRSSSKHIQTDLYLNTSKQIFI